jgi:hypothetical protein
MIDPLNNELIPIAQVARRLPKFNGRHPNPSTLYRWCTSGLDGRKLEHVRVGRRICTTEDALSEFLCPSDCSPTSHEDRGSEANENPRHEDVAARLTADGI